MADDIEPLSQRYILDTTQYRKELQRLRQETRKFAEDFKRVGRNTSTSVHQAAQANTQATKAQAVQSSTAVERSMKRMGDTANSVSSRIRLAVVGAMLAAVASVKNFVESAVGGLAKFQSQMIQSTAIFSGMTDEMFDKMSEKARELAISFNFKPEQVAEGFFFLASAGLSAEQALAALPAVAQFAKAGMFDLAQATDLSTDALSALGLKSQDPAKNLDNLRRVMDVLVTANKQANATVEQFSRALTTRAGATLKVYNKQIEEGVAVLAAWADQGVKGEAAGTALGIVTRDLTTKAVENASAFKQAGVAVFDSSGKMRHYADIIEDLENLLRGMSDETAKATLKQLGFADRSLVFIQTLLGLSGAIRGYEANLKTAAGSTETLADTQMTAPMERFGKVVQNIKRLMQEKFGAPLLEEILKVVDRLNENFDEFGPQIVSTITSVGRMAAVFIGMKIAIIALNIAIVTLVKLKAVYTAATYAARIAVALLTGNMIKLRASWELLNASIRRNPIGLFLSILAAVAAEFLFFRDNVDEATKAIERQEKAVGRLIDEIRNLRGVQLFQRKVELLQGIDESGVKLKALKEDMERLRSAQIEGGGITGQGMFGPFQGSLDEFRTFLDQSGPIVKTGDILPDWMAQWLGVEGGERELAGTVSVQLDGVTQVLQVSEAFELLDQKMAEFQEVSKTGSKSYQGLLEVMQQGASDLQFQLANLEDAKDKLVKNRALEDLTQTEIDNLKRLNKNIAETEEKIRAIDSLGEDIGTDKPNPLSGMIDESVIERAKESLEQIQLQIRKAAELAEANKEIKETIQDIFDVEDKIRRLRNQEKDVPGTAVGAQIRSQIEALEKQRDALRNQIVVFENFRATIEMIAEGASNAFDTIAKGADTSILSAALLAELTRIQDELGRQLTEIDIMMTAPQLDEGSKERLLQQIDTLTEDTRKSVIALFESLGANLSRLAPEVAEAFQSILKDLEIDDAEKERFLREITSVLDGLERDIGQKEILLLLKLKDPDDFREEVEVQAKQAKEVVEKLWNDLPPRLKANKELLELILGLLDKITDSANAAGTKLTRMGESLDKIADMLSAIGRFANVFGDLGDDVAAFVNGLSEAINNTSKLVTNIQLIKDNELTGLGAVAGIAVPAIGIATGIASIVSGFVEASNAQKEAMKQLREAINRNTEAIYDQMEAAFQGGIVGQGVSGNTIRDASAIIQQILGLRGTNQGRRDDLFRDLGRLGIPGMEGITDIRNQLNDLIASSLSQFLTTDMRRNLTDMILFDKTSPQDLISQFGFDPQTLAIVMAFLNKLPVEINNFVEFLNNLDAGLGTFTGDVDGASEMLRIMKLMGVDTQDQMEKFIDFLFSNIGDLPNIFKGRGGILSQISGLDLTSSEDRQKLRDLVAKAFADIAEGGFDFGDLTPEEMITVLETLLGFAEEFGGAVDAMSDAMREATSRFNIMTDILGIDSLEAVRSWITTFMGGLPEMDSELRDLLTEAAGLDLNSEQGALRFQEIVRFLAEAFLSGNTFGMDPEQFEQLLGTLDQFSDQAVGNVSASRSVQFLRTITEFQGNELVLLANERNWVLRGIADDVKRIVDIMRITPAGSVGSGALMGPMWGQRRTVNVPRSLLTVTSQSTQVGGMSERHDRMSRGVDNVVMNVSITTQPTMRRIMADMEREIRRVERSTFNGEKLFG